MRQFNFNFLNVIQKGSTTAGTVQTNIHVPSSVSSENISADPDEAIRRRLAELRSDDSCTGKAYLRGAGMAQWWEQSDRGSILGPGAMCVLSLLLVLTFAPRVFLRVLQIPSLKNQHFQIPI